MSRRARFAALLLALAVWPALVAAQLVNPGAPTLAARDGLIAPDGPPPITFDFSTAGTLPAGATFTRASLGWFTEGANYVRNPSAIGAVPGTPGTLPTYWAIAGTQGTLGLTLSTVNANGIQYLRARFFGTTSSVNVGFYFDAANVIPALNGQTWTESFSAALSAGSLANITVASIYMVERQAGGTFVKSISSDITPTATPQQFSQTRLLTGGATTAAIQPGILLTFPIGVAIDVTLDIGSPALSTASKPFVPQLVTANNDTARWTYDATAQLLGLLIEPAQTNLVWNSQTMTGSGSLGLSRASLTQAATTAPTGALTAPKLVEDTSPAINHVLNFFPGAIVSGQTYTISVFAKAGERTRLRFRTGSGFASAGAFFDLETGLIDGITGGAVPAIVPYANGWYRIAITVPANASVSGSTINEMVSTGIVTGYDGDGVSGNFVWGGQFVADQLTSYIDTTTAAVTRAADVLKVPLANGTYDLDIVRASGTQSLTGQIASGGLLTVPTDPSPLRNITARRIGP